MKICGTESDRVSDRSIFRWICIEHGGTEYIGILEFPALLHFTRTDLETYHMDFNADRQQYHFSVDHDDVLLSAWNCVGARVGNFPF